MGATDPVFVRRYTITHSYLPYGILSHVAIGLLIAGYLALTTELQRLAAVWFTVMCATLVLRHIAQGYLVNKLQYGIKSKRLFDLLFAIAPSLNSATWGIGYCFLLHYGDQSMMIGATLVLTAMAFTGFTYLTLSRASYIGFFVFSFVPPFIYFLFIDVNHAVAAVIFVGMFHFVAFNSLVYHISSRALNADHEQRVLINKLTETELKLSELAQKDPLTGLHNRLSYDKRFKQIRYQSLINKQPLNLAIVDVDHFKQLNDEYGHLSGDEVLQRLAELMKGELNDDVVIGRFGGEEFIVITTGLSRSEFKQMLQGVIDTVSLAKLVSTAPEHKVTVSIGATVQSHPQQLAFCLEPADNALYLAKSLGRNQVRFDDEIKPQTQA